jgi:hypothetical protein
MALAFIPRIARTGQDLTLTWPMAVSRPVDRPTGGGEKSASGVPSNYVIAWEPLLYVTFRVLETEWANVSTFLRAVDEGGLSFTFYPDAAITGTSYTVYLESPSVRNGESIEPQREQQDLGMYLLPLTLRKSTNTVWGVNHG